MRHHHVAKALALTLLCLLLVPGCEQGDEPVQVALILSGASGHYWENIVEGAQTAASAWTSPCAATCRTRKRRSGSRTCRRRPARDGADALVVASQGQQELLDALEGIDLPLIAVGTQIEGAEAAVLNDDAKMGQSVAQALAASLAEGDGVLLLADSAEYRETDLRETSLRENLAAKGVTVRGRFFSGDNREWAYRQTLQQLYLWPDLDAIVAFSAKATVGAAQAAQYLDRDIPIVGTDIVTELIACIEDGSVDATIVRNSFGMGYLGVERAAGPCAGSRSRRCRPSPASRSRATTSLPRRSRRSSFPMTNKKRKGRWNPWRFRPIRTSTPRSSMS